MTTRDDNQPRAETAGDWCARVLTLLDDQWQAFEQLASLVVSKHAQLDDAQGGELLRLIDARRPIVERIETIDAKLVACQPSWDRNMRQLGPRDRDKINEAIAAVARLADGIAQQDKDDRSRLEQRRDAIADELMAVSRGKSAAGAYAGTPDNAPRFQDREA